MSTNKNERDARNSKPPLSTTPLGEKRPLNGPVTDRHAAVLSCDTVPPEPDSLSGTRTYGQICRVELGLGIWAV